MQRSAMVVESRTGTSIAGGPNRKKNRTAANPPTVLGVDSKSLLLSSSWLSIKVHTRLCGESRRRQSPQ